MAQRYLLLMIGWLVAGHAPAMAKPPWNQAANIREAAERLIELQRARGPLGTFKYIADCYRTHGLASRYSEAFEACIVQDYIHSTLTAALYQRIPKEEREKMRAPEPEALMQAMTQRIAQAFAQYKVPAGEAQAFLLLVNQHGLKEFGKLLSGEPAPGEGQDRPPAPGSKGLEGE